MTSILVKDSIPVLDSLKQIPIFFPQSIDSCLVPKTAKRR